MRLNKEIREYIENQIYQKAMDNDELRELEDIYNRQAAALEIEIRKITDEANQKLAALTASYEYSKKNWNGIEEPLQIAATTYVRGGLTSFERYRELKNRLEAKASEKAKDIIFDIQLGGTKDQLREMLENVTFEEDENA